MLLLCTGQNLPFALELISVSFQSPDNPLTWIFANDRGVISSGQVVLSSKQPAPRIPGGYVCNFMLFDGNRAPQGTISQMTFPPNEGSQFLLASPQGGQYAMVVKKILFAASDAVAPSSVGVVVGAGPPPQAPSPQNAPVPGYSTQPPADVPFRRPGCRQVLCQSINLSVPTSLYFWLDSLGSSQAGWMFERQDHIYRSGAAALSGDTWNLMQNGVPYATIRGLNFRPGAEFTVAIAAGNSTFRVVSVETYAAATQ